MKKIIFAVIVLVILLLPTQVLGFNINNSSTGFSEGGYDLKAQMPTTVNWSQQSIYKVFEEPYKKWELVDYDNVISISDQVVGSDGTIYYANDYDRLVAVNPDGTVKWSLITPHIGQCLSSTTPAIAKDGTIIFAMVSCKRNGSGLTNPGGFLFAVTPEGKIKWQYTPKTEYTDLYGPPVIASDGEIYLTAFKVDSDEMGIIAISADGKKERMLATFKNINPNTDVNIRIGQDNNLYVQFEQYKNVYSPSITNKYLLVLKPTGEEIRLIKGSGQDGIASPVVFGKDMTVYALYKKEFESKYESKYYLCAYDKNGKKKWMSSIAMPYATNPVVSGDGTIYVYSYDKMNDYPYASFGGKLHAFNPNGTVKWIKDINGSAGYNPVISSDGIIYMLTGEPTPKNYYITEAYISAFYPDGTSKWTFKTGYYIGFDRKIVLMSGGTLCTILTKPKSETNKYNEPVLLTIGTKEKPSGWAVAEIAQANEAGIITKSNEGKYTIDITRAQFAELVVNMLEKVLEKELPDTGKVFNDCDDIAVLKAYKAGIVNGTSKTTFSPNELITREQISSMLYNAIIYIEMEKGEVYTKKNSEISSSYIDKDKVSSWAKIGVGVLANNGIMGGTSATTLSPKSNANVEQSVILVYRLYNILY